MFRSSEVARPTSAAVLHRLGCGGGRGGGWGVAAGARAAAVTVAGAVLLVGLTVVPSSADPLPATASAPVVGLDGPVVAFYAGTAEVDGSTTLEPTKTGSRSRLDCTILFAKDSDVLRPGAAVRLRRLADQLHAQTAGRVAVTGYTDDLGSTAHGLDLSERRARRVAHELRRVLPARRFPITVRGLGEAHPAVPNTSEANRRQNRRVVVTLTRTTTPARATTQHVPATPAPTPTPTTAEIPTRSTAPTPTEPAGTGTPSAAAAPPPEPPVPPTSSTPTRPGGGFPWPLIGGWGAALVGLGVLADTLRRRRPRPDLGTDGPDTATPSPDERSGDVTADDRRPTAAGGQARLPDTALPMSPRGVPALPAFAASSRVGATGGAPAVLAGMARPPEPLGPAAPAHSTEPAGASKPSGSAGSPAEAALRADLEAWRSRDTHRPRLTLLGPVHARTRGQALARRRPFYTELFAYLVLHPNGATVEEIGEAFTLTPARVRTDIKILRDWLGTDPRTGRAYLPDARTTPAALRRGVAVYQLETVLCDWDLFQRLRRNTAHQTRRQTESERVADLEAGLDLVSGRPFDQVRPAGWGWLFEGDRVDLHATQAVLDVAVDLTAYHHAHGDQQAAARVADLARTVDPDHPQATMVSVRGGDT